MITLWHNPRCSKSRAALKLVEESGKDFTLRRYLEDAPTRAEIQSTLAALGCTPVEMMRTGEKVFKDLGLSKTSPDDDLIEAMAANPILIERPILIAGEKAVIGRPPENVLKLL